MVMFVAIRIERMNIMIMMVTIGHDGDDEVGSWSHFLRLCTNRSYLHRFPLRRRLRRTAQEDHNDQNKDDENQDHDHDDQDSQLGTSLRLNVTRLIGPIGQYGHHKKNTGRGC